VRGWGVSSFLLCLEASEGAKVKYVKKKKRSVDSPHLLHSPTTYLGEEMRIFF